MKLTDFEVLSFDCYGTLIDWESGITQALAQLVRRSGRELTRDQVLEAHARHESAQQRWTPGKRYSDLLAVVHKRLAEEWGVATRWDDARAYGQSVADWPVFADTVEALRYLKRHYRLVILSNVDDQSFAVSAARLQVPFDAVYTAEDIGSYKPSSRNFAYLLEQLKALGVDKAKILHTAESLFHDHEPAKASGLATCWIHRRHASGGFGATMPPASPPAVDFRFTCMAELASAHRQALQG